MKINRVLEILTVMAAFLLPIFFLPILADSYDLAKQLLLLSVVVIGFVLAGGYLLVKGKIPVNRIGKWHWWAALIGVFAVSTLLNSTNRWWSLTGPMGLGTVVVLALFYLLVSFFGKRKMVLGSLITGGVLVSVVNVVLTLTKATGLKLPLGLVIGQGWSVVGGQLPQLVFLVMCLVLAGGLVVEKMQKRQVKGLVVAGLVMILVTLGTLSTAYLLMRVAKPVLLSQKIGWMVAVEMLKNWRLAFFGIGPNQYANAFAGLKPMAFNGLTEWGVRFNYSSNWYFHLMSEIGVVGLVVYLVLVYRYVRRFVTNLRQKTDQWSTVDWSVNGAIVAGFLMQVFMPVTFVSLAILVVLVAVDREEREVEFDVSNRGQIAGVILVLPAIVLGVMTFYGAKIALGSYHYYRSLIAFNNNDGAGVYNNLISSIRYNPRQMDYRIAYSQTNLRLAGALAGKTDLTEQERTDVTTLIQQAVAEGKAAVSLDQANPAGWENLASIYQNIINFANGADQWVVSAYQQAINLDPLNPLLRLNLGGVYYGLKNYDQAISFYAQAVQLKGDWPNAHYNLANALKDKSLWQQAKSEYDVTLSLVPLDSAEYQKVKQELAEVEKNLPSPTPAPTGETGSASGSGQLTTPVVPKGINPPIDLPAESEPPVSVIPTVIPVPTEILP